MSGKRVALYARVSTSNKGQDVTTQLRELSEVAARMGWQPTEFVDEGQSGRKISRPAFDRMLDAVRRRRFDVVCAWRLDRLTQPRECC
jgi:DNA invertase Pin-like site-specific DNA recombinase